MKKLFFASVCALTLFSCGRDETEIQSENQVKIASLKTKDGNNTFNNKFGTIYVYRHYSNSLMKHSYGSETGPIGQHDWSYEGVAFKVEQTGGGGAPLTLMVNATNLDNIIATNIADVTALQARGYIIREYLGVASTYGGEGTSLVPVYKYYRSSKNGHFYTKNLNELGWGGNGWTYEGIAFYVDKNL